MNQKGKQELFTVTATIIETDVASQMDIKTDFADHTDMNAVLFGHFMNHYTKEMLDAAFEKIGCDFLDGTRTVIVIPFFKKDTQSTDMMMTGFGMRISSKALTQQDTDVMDGILDRFVAALGEQIIAKINEYAVLLSATHGHEGARRLINDFREKGIIDNSTASVFLMSIISNILGELVSDADIQSAQPPAQPPAKEEEVPLSDVFAEFLRSKGFDV